MLSQACLRCGERQELVVDLDLRGVPHGFAGHDTVYDWDTVLSCPGCEFAAHVSLRKTSAYTHKLRIDPNVTPEGERPFAKVTLSDDGLPTFAY